MYYKDQSRLHGESAGGYNHRSSQIQRDYFDDLPILSCCRRTGGPLHIIIYNTFIAQCSYKCSATTRMHSTRVRACICMQLHVAACSITRACTHKRKLCGVLHLFFAFQFRSLHAAPLHSKLDQNIMQILFFTTYIHVLCSPCIILRKGPAKLTSAANLSAAFLPFYKLTFYTCVTFQLRWPLYFCAPLYIYNAYNTSVQNI